MPDPPPIVPSPRQELPGDLISFDTLTAGMTQVTAGYLVKAPRPALVDCGPALSVASIIAGLAEAGLEPDDLAYLLLSHIHLDHAGGAGDVAAAFPNATVVVHESGARHLVDPARLNAGAEQAFGPLFDSVYGACAPVPAERIRTVSERETVDLGGGRRLELLHTPGHARHHIGVFDPDTGDLFVGDSVGVKLPGMAMIRPATPAPDFDDVLAQRSLDTYIELAPTTVHLAHYGAVDPPLEALLEAKERLALWVNAADGAWGADHDLEHLAETLGQRFADDLGELSADPAAAARLDLLVGARSNATGLAAYLQRRSQDEQTQR